MSDKRLRERERRFKETGAVEDEGSYLLERIRAGAATRRGIELAATLGDPGARAAIPEAPFSAEDTFSEDIFSEDMFDNLRKGEGFADSDRVHVTVASRAMLAAVREAIDTVADQLTDERYSDIPQFLSAFSRWILDPSEDNSIIGGSISSQT